MVKIKFRFLFFILLGIFLLLCVTSSRINKKGITDIPYSIEEELNFPSVKEPYKYIFLRLNDAEYASSLNPTNILKFGISCTEVSDMRVSHASINFSLDDDFYGLSIGGKHQLAKESCMDVSTNKFMKKCNPETSNQITFAIKVTEDEYNRTKKFVEDYANGTDIKYDALHNLSIAVFATRRKFFTDPEGQPFGAVEYRDPETARREVGPDYVENKFVCSTFVAYCLMKNIPSIAKWFNDNQIDYRYVGVSDLGEIPGVVRLFSSKFYEYDHAASLFVEKFPEFKPYFSKAID